jgi:hypothetical protein
MKKNYLWIVMKLFLCQQFWCRYKRNSSAKSKNLQRNKKITSALNQRTHQGEL